MGCASCFHIILILVLAQVFWRWNTIDASGDSPLKSSPKDYAFSLDGSRVRDLASYFESMRKKEFEVSDENDQNNVIITQSEAASKLQSLSFGLTLEDRCSKYIKLITKPNIRTYAAVNLLVHEDKMFEDIEQTSANLESRLLNERKFNALGKLQSIIQTLESEKSNMKSTFSPEVQKDLLDCMSYYIYRHQRAVLGLTDYIQRSQNALIDLVGNTKETDIVREELIKLMDNVKIVETKEGELGQKSTRVWMQELSKLYQVLINNQLKELPQIVIDFITNEKRLERLNQLQTDTKLTFEDSKHLEKLQFDQATNSEETAKQAEISSLILSNSDQIMDNDRLTEVMVDVSHAKKALNTNFAETTFKNEPVSEVDSLNLNPESSCEQLSALFDKDLMGYNWNHISIEQCKSLALLISKYKVNCFSNPDHQFSQQIHWSFVSVSKKLVSRSLQELENISNAQLSVTDVLKLLNN